MKFFESITIIVAKPVPLHFSDLLNRYNEIKNANNFNYLNPKGRVV
jgi:hypothetical protein